MWVREYTHPLGKQEKEMNMPVQPFELRMVPSFLQSGEFATRLKMVEMQPVP